MTIASLQKNKKKLVKAIKEADRKDIRINVKDSSMINKTVEMALKDNKLNIEDLL